MKKKKMKKIILITTMVMVFVLGIFVGNVFSKSREITFESEEGKTQIVETTVGLQTIENTLTGSGEILESDSEKLELSTSKYFQVMCVEEDDLVSEGDPILEYTNGTYLTAPYNCRISSISVPETGSKCTSAHYIEIDNVQTMTMSLQISESEINQVEKGQEATITLSAIEEATYTGTIQSISSVGSYSSSGTTFEAVIAFENDGQAKIGMGASCSIVIAKAENVVAIPIEAVQTSNGEKYVVCVNEDGTTENKTIETGISNDSYVEVTSGLSEGETIQMTQTVSSSSSVRGGFSQNGGGRGQMPDMSGFSMEMPSGGSMPERN